MKVRLSAKKNLIVLCLLFLSIEIYKKYQFGIRFQFDKYFSALEFWKHILFGSVYTALYLIPICAIIGYMLSVIVLGVGHLLIQKRILKSHYTLPITLWGRINLGLAIGVVLYALFTFS